MPKQANPGVPEGSEVIFIGSNFGGWVSNVTYTDGAVPHYSGATEGVEAATIAKQSQNQYSESDGISLFRANRMGHIAPGAPYAAITDASVLINALPVNGDVESNSGYANVVLQNGRLVQINLSAGTVTSFTPSAHTPITTNDCDTIVFRDGTGAEWSMSTWEWSSGGDIILVTAKDLSTFTTDSFWSSSSYLNQSTALKSGVPHKLCVGPDANVYVLDGNYVRQIVIPAASAMSANNAATLGLSLNIGYGWIAQGICAYKNYVAIIASKNIVSGASRGAVRVFLWDGTSTLNASTGNYLTIAQYVYDIPDNAGQAVHFDGTNLFAFTSGRNYSSKIFELTGKGFKKTFETSLITPSTTALQGRIENFQDGLVFSSTKGGSSAPNTFLFRYYGGGFHCDSQMGSVNNGSIGMVRNFYQNQLFVGYADGSGNYFIMVNDDTKYLTSVSLRSILFTEGILGRRQYPLGFKGTVNRILIYLSQWGTGASLTLSLFNGYDPMVVGGSADVLNLTLDTDTGTAESINHHAFPVGTREIDISDFAAALDISSFYMNIKFSHASSSNTAAIVRRIIVFWSPSQ